MKDTIGILLMIICFVGCKQDTKKSTNSITIKDQSKVKIVEILLNSNPDSAPICNWKYIEGAFGMKFYRSEGRDCYPFKFYNVLVTIRKEANTNSQLITVYSAKNTCEEIFENQTLSPVFSESKNDFVGLVDHSIFFEESGADLKPIFYIHNLISKHILAGTFMDPVLIKGKLESWLPIDSVTNAENCEKFEEFNETFGVSVLRRKLLIDIQRSTIDTTNTIKCFAEN